MYGVMRVPSMLHMEVKQLEHSTCGAVPQVSVRRSSRNHSFLSVLLHAVKVVCSRDGECV